MTEEPITDHQLKRRDLELRRQQLELERAKLFIEFAKFGFSGTLTAAVGGMVFVLALAILSALSSFKIDSWALVAMAVIIVLGSIAFGFLSLWQAPNIAARFRNMQIAITGGASDRSDANRTA
jgi:hypothetical protein